MDRVPESYRPLIERTRAALAGKGAKTPADRNAWAEGLGLADPATEPVDVVFYAGCKYSLEESLRETGDAGRALQPPLTVGCSRTAAAAFEMGYCAEAAEAGARTPASSGRRWRERPWSTPCADLLPRVHAVVPRRGRVDGRGPAHVADWSIGSSRTGG